MAHTVTARGRRTGVRKMTAAVAGLLTLGLVVTGCSSSEDDTAAGQTDSAQSAEDSLLPAAEGRTEYPLTLKTPYGETTLEKRPERIAIVGGGGDMEVALSLGVSPVLAANEADSWEFYAPYKDQFADAVVMNPWTGYDIETVAEQEPDLIVASTMTDMDKEFDRLAAIAPVVAPATGKSDSWEELTRDLGEALDLSEAADTVVDDTHAAVADLRKEHPEFAGKTVSVLVNRGSAAGIEFTNGSGSPTEQLLSDLGFAEQPNADKMTGPGGRGEVSLENIGLIDADVIMIGQHGGRGTAEEARTWLDGDATYRNIPAVTAGRVVELPVLENGSLPLSWALAYLNPISIPYAAQQLSDLAAEALAKENK